MHTQWEHIGANMPLEGAAASGSSSEIRADLTLEDREDREGSRGWLSMLRAVSRDDVMLRNVCLPLSS